MHLYEQHCSSKTTPQLLTETELNVQLKEIPEWKVSPDKGSISRTYKFKDYHQTLLFINTAVVIINKENHHPDIQFGYNRCSIQFSTHSAGGITIFDLICAAQIEQLLAQQNLIHE